jgi:hypothetical protein
MVTSLLCLWNGGQYVTSDQLRRWKFFMKSWFCSTFADSSDCFKSITFTAFRLAQIPIVIVNVFFVDRCLSSGRTLRLSLKALSAVLFSFFCFTLTQLVQYIYCSL